MTNFIKTPSGVINALDIASIQYYNDKGVAISNKYFSLMKYIEETEQNKAREFIELVRNQLFTCKSSNGFCSLPNGGVIEKQLISSTTIINEVNVVINGRDNKAIAWIECPNEPAAQTLLSQLDDALSSDKKGLFPIDWDTHLGLETSTSAEPIKSLSLKNSKANNS